MKIFRDFAKNHRKLTITIGLLYFIILGGCTFPIYNLGREWPPTLTISILSTASITYIFLGIVETSMFPKAKAYHIIPLNFALILSSMACRYLLEYGEVSNTYNFTTPNIILHIAATMVISTGFWLIADRTDYFIQ